MGRQTVLPGHGLEIHQLVQPDCGCVVCFYQQHHAPGLIAVQRFGQQLSPVAFSAIFRQDINIVWLVLFKAMGLLGAEHRVRKKRIALKTADEFTTVFVATDILDHV